MTESQIDQQIDINRLLAVIAGKFGPFELGVEEFGVLYADVPTTAAIHFDFDETGDLLTIRREDDN
jgi:hypothetical protein